MTKSLTRFAAAIGIGAGVDVGCDVPVEVPGLADRVDVADRARVR